MLSGCATPPFCGRELIELRNSVRARNEELARRMEEVRELQSRLEQKNEELKAQEAQVQELKTRLRNFGVF